MTTRARGAAYGPTDQPKRPFDIDEAIARIRPAVQPFKKAALFELAEEGHKSVFEQLCACIISIRTLDEVTLPTARKLFARARTPAGVAALSVEELDDLVHDCAFHEPKARQIHAIARRAIAEFGGELPCDFEVLTSFSGVGPKCANLTLGIACGQARIAVDVHVHRIANRWGYVRTSAPEQTMRALEKTLPERYWVEINRLLIPFGKNICTGTLPMCSQCPVLEMCQQQDVTSHR
ncbi:MAG TPA: endonuclease III [Chloroflexota bacterium]